MSYISQLQCCDLYKIKYRFKVLVCNYGPGGNIIDKPVYQIGEPGSECPEGTTSTKKGLCERNAKGHESNGRL